MQIIKSNISDKWLKASVMGSIWAANEILLGSFLHNIRIPLSGTIMAFLSVALMVSFSELWKEKGLIWRAALIAALMKSISPSAIILGPMVGIAMEGILLSLGILLLGRNLYGYIVGGAFAVTSILIQKIGRLLISYGFDFLEILNNMFIFASKQLRFSTDNGIILVLTLLGIYVVAGASGAILGYYGGKTALNLKKLNWSDKKDGSKTHLFEKSEKRSYSIVLLILHFVAIIGGMLLINTASLWIVIPYILVYSAFCIFHYKGAIRRLKNPTFWIWFVGITFLASYFLGDWQGSMGFNIDGLREGLLMNLRAIQVLFGFAAISTELRNPIIKMIMYKRGAANLYQSIELAFSILPIVLESFPKNKELMRKPAKNMAGLIRRADDLLNMVTQENRNRSTVLILTGETQQGKTSLLKTILKELQYKGVEADGFYTEVMLRDSERVGYSLKTINSSESLLLCSRNPEAGKRRYGKFYFNGEALAKGNLVLKKAVEKESPLIIIDEIGPMEMSGDGWADSIENICNNSEIPMIWTVRKSLAGKAARKWNVGDVYIVDISDINAKEEVWLAITEMQNSFS